jgi:hypothetical protein
MKKNRSCGGGIMYPMYSTMPMMQPPVMGPIPSYQAQTNNNIETQINNIQEQINSLENRVSKLESKNTTTYNNKYNDSNYYML